jgi:hypothetical protein
MGMAQLWQYLSSIAFAPFDIGGYCPLYFHCTIGNMTTACHVSGVL